MNVHTSEPAMQAPFAIAHHSIRSAIKNPNIAATRARA